jgi:hypothetical protein
MSSPLTILIAAAGQPNLLVRTLDSLAACQRPASLAETIVVENGPRCGIESLVRDRPRDERVRYLYVPEANKSHALNVALARLEGLIFFTDDDTRFDSGLLLAYDRAASGVTAGEFYGGPLRPDYEGDPPPRWLRSCLPKTAIGWEEKVQTKTLLSRTFLGPNWAAFAGDLRSIGGFDPRFGPGAVTKSTGQETDAQTRLRASGRQGYYVPDALAWHFVRKMCCTPQWAIQRGYRHGLEWGIRVGRNPDYSSVTERFIRFRRARRQLLNRLMRIVGSERLRVYADYIDARWKGRWEGIALGRKWNEIAVPEMPPEIKRAA